LPVILLQRKKTNSHGGQCVVKKPEKSGTMPIRRRVPKGLNLTHRDSHGARFPRRCHNRPEFLTVVVSPRIGDEASPKKLARDLTVNRKVIDCDTRSPNFLLPMEQFPI